MEPYREDMRHGGRQRPRGAHAGRGAQQGGAHRNHDLLGAFLAVALCLVFVWGFGAAYQVGYAACENCHAQEAGADE